VKFNLKEKEIAKLTIEKKRKKHTLDEISNIPMKSTF
jgi:hypothetical protein